MPLYSNEELLEQLRAIGWTDSDIARDYPDLLPYYFTGEPTTLYERLLSIGWSEERIREEYPEILPAEEGGILETIGDPVYTRGDRAGDPVDEFTQGGIIGGTTGPVIGDPNDPYKQEAPSIGSNQTADLGILALLFL